MVRRAAVPFLEQCGKLSTVGDAIRLYLRLPMPPLDRLKNERLV